MFLDEPNLFDLSWINLSFSRNHFDQTQYAEAWIEILT